MADQNNEAIAAAARALSDRNANVCNVNRDDNWKIYGEDFIGDAKAAIEAYLAATPAVPAPEATSEPDEPTDREQLIACLGDDAATLIAQNPDDEMAQTMLDAAAMLEATSEQMGGAQVAKAETVLMSDEDIDIIWQTMPGGPGAWLKGFGYQAFAKAIEDEVILNHKRNFATNRVAEGEATERKPLTDAWLNENLHSYFSYSGNKDNMMWASTEDIVYFARAIEQHHGIGSDK